jgi:hypothetical protein
VKRRYFIVKPEKREDTASGVTQVMKHLCSVFAAAAMLSPTVIPLLYPPPPDPTALTKWKAVLVGVSIAGLIALAIQLILQRGDDRKRDEVLERLVRTLSSPKEELERDKRFEELASLIPKSPLNPVTREIKQQEQKQALRDRAVQLGRDLFEFMREKGPDPEVIIDKNKSLEEQIRHVMQVRGPYVESIHYGYMAHFRDRVVKMFNELAEIGIALPNEIQPWELDPPQVQNAERVRKIAENLFLIATKMDIAAAAKGT